jgi:hypothetical protein
MEVSPPPSKEVIRLNQSHKTLCMLMHAATLLSMIKACIKHYNNEECCLINYNLCFVLLFICYIVKLMIVDIGSAIPSSNQCEYSCN